MKVGIIANNDGNVEFEGGELFERSQDDNFDER